MRCVATRTRAVTQDPSHFFEWLSVESGELRRPKRVETRVPLRPTRRSIGATGSSGVASTLLVLLGCVVTVSQFHPKLRPILQSSSVSPHHAPPLVATRR